MAHWIDVGEDGRQLAYFRDPTFPFGVFMDDYGQMDGRALPLHWHPAAEFQVVCAGTVRMRLHDTVCLLRKGDCIFVNSGALHGAEQIGNESALVAVVSFTPFLLTDSVQSSVYHKYFDPLFGRETAGFPVDPSSEPGGRMLEILRQLIALDTADAGYELTVIRQMSGLWWDTLRYAKQRQPDDTQEEKLWKQNETVKTLLVYVAQHYTEPVTVDSLSDAAHLSRRECFRYFQRYTGLTPMEYLSDYRIAQAAHLLSTTEQSVLKVGLSCGFSSQSYFSKRFREKYGCTPSAYRTANGMGGELLTQKS